MSSRGGPVLPLDGKIVYERGGSAACAMAGRVLWELGAAVYRHQRETAPGDAVDSLLSTLLHHGKQTCTPSEAAAAGGGEGLSDACDVILLDSCDRQPDVAGLRAIADGRVRAGSPGPVVVEFGWRWADAGTPEPQMEELQEQFASGLSWRVGSKGSDLARGPVPAADRQVEYLAALNGVVAALAALSRKDGRAENVQVAKRYAPAWAFEVPFFCNVYGDGVYDRSAVTGGYEVLTTKDGVQVQALLGSQGQWDAMVEVMGHPDWATSEAFATRLDRSANWDGIIALLREWVSGFRSGELIGALSKARIPCAPVRTMAEVVSSDQLRVRGFFRPGAGSACALPRLPWAAPSLPSRYAKEEEIESLADRAARAPRPRSAQGSVGRANRPLEGLVVADFGHAIAGSLTSEYLGFLGAEVIKIETDQPVDILRLMRPLVTTGGPDGGGLFCQINLGKRSVKADLRTPEGLDLALAIIERADVVVENFSPGTMTKIGLGYELLAARNPDLVMISLSGFGASGPDRDLVAFGAQIAGVSGLASMTGHPDSTPLSVGVYPDIPSGLFGAIAAVAALMQRDQGRGGTHVDLSELEAMTFLLPAALAEVFASGYATRRGARSRCWSPSGAYPAAGDDKWVAITVRTSEEWRALCALTGWPQLAHLSLESRRERADEIDELLRTWTAARSDQESVALLLQSGIPAQPYMDSGALLADPVFVSEAMIQVDHPVLGQRLHLRPPFEFQSAPFALQRRSPLLGEHTAEVERELKRNLSMAAPGR